MITTYPIRQRDLLILILILFVAGLMRFGEAQIVEFFHDDAMLSTLAQRLVAGEEFPLTGILSSVGIPNSPVSVYIMAIPFAISSHPMIAIYFVMLLNVIGVGLLWIIAHRYFGRTVGLIAGFTYAISPWAIFYSRKIWAQDFHTPILLLALLLGLYGFWEGTRRANSFANFHWWAQLLCLPVLLIGVQIHFAGWFLLPAYLILLWVGRKNIPWLALGASLLLSILVLLPYVLGLAQTLEQDPTRITDALARSDANAGLSITTEPLLHILYLATGLGLETVIDPLQPAEVLDNVPTLSGVWGILGILSVIGVFALIFDRGKRIFFGLLLAWAFFTPLVFMLDWTPVFPHYFIPMIPIYALLIGIGFNWLIEHFEKLTSMPYSQSVGLVALVVLLLTQAIWWRGLLRYIDTTETPYPGITTPIHYLNDVYNEVKSVQDVVVLSYGMAWNLHHESAVWPVMLRDSVDCTRTLPGEGYVVFPKHPFTVLVALDAPANPVESIYTTPPPLSFPTRSDHSYVIHEFEQAPTWEMTSISSIEPAVFEPGVQLTGYHLEENMMVLEWQLPDAYYGLNYQYSGQFLDENLERLGQFDTSFWMGRHWCAGDRLVTWASTTVPIETSTLRVSLYQLGTGKDTGRFFSANVLDDLGNPSGQWVDIPLNS